MVGKCYHDHERNNEKNESIRPKSFIPLAKGIYIIDKNWNQVQKDSLIETDSSIKVLKVSNDPLLFISAENDSITIEPSKIHSKNPIIIYNGNNSPMLCSLNELNRTKSFLFPKEAVETISDTSAFQEDIRLFISEPKPVIEQKQDRILLGRADYLQNKAIIRINYSREKPILQAAPSLELSDRSLYYPLINNNQFLNIRFDNDFWDYTDYYYTNGIGLGYTHPIFASSPLSYLLISNGNSGVDYYGIHLAQHMYTGSQPKVDTIIPGDRPWAAYSILGQFLKSFDRNHQLTHYSEINLGIIGPQSGGGFIQDLVHTLLPNNSPPEGWHNQIATDILIDYQYQIQKLLWESKAVETYITAGAQVGTLRDNLRWGFGGKVGNFIPFYKDISIYRRSRVKPSFNRKLRFGFIADIQTQLIGYDATLQGGVTNRTSVYTIPSGDISRFVIEGFGGVTVSYGRVELNFIQYWKSKEFKTGKDHKYVSVRLNIAF